MRKSTPGERRSGSRRPTGRRRRAPARRFARAARRSGRTAAGRPEHLRGRDQPRPRRDRREDRVRVGLRRRRRAAGEAPTGPEQAEVLVRRRDDLVVRPEPEAARARSRSRRRGRVGERDLRRLGADERGERRPQPRRGAPASPRSTAVPLRPRARSSATAPMSASATGCASGPNVPAFRYATVSSTGNSRRASSNVMPHRPRRAPRRRGGRRARRHSARGARAATRRPRPTRAPRTSTWSIPLARRRSTRRGTGSVTLKSPASTTTSPGRRDALGERGARAPPRPAARRGARSRSTRGGSRSSHRRFRRSGSRGRAAARARGSRDALVPEVGRRVARARRGSRSPGPRAPSGRSPGARA